MCIYITFLTLYTKNYVVLNNSGINKIFIILLILLIAHIVLKLI